MAVSEWCKISSIHYSAEEQCKRNTCVTVLNRNRHENTQCELVISVTIIVGIVIITEKK